MGQSSRAIEVSGEVTVESTVELPKHYTADSIFLDIMADPKAMKAIEPMMAAIKQTLAPETDAGGAAKEAVSDDMGAAMMNYMPLRGMLSFAPDKMTDETMEQLLKALNG